MLNSKFTDTVFRGFGYVLAFVGVCLLLAMPVHAQTDAYSIQVAVSDRSDDEQMSAHIIGMRSVLLANSGDKTLLNRDDVRDALRAADTYVEAFRYNTPEPGTVIPRGTPVTDSVRSTGKATQIMQIQFNPALINELIRPSSEPAPEPDENFDPFRQVSSALLWLVVEDGGQQVLIGANRGQNVMERSREIAGSSSITLNFPAGDTTDEQALSADNIKASNIDAVTKAASRYAQAVTLAAHLSRSRTGGWESSWLKVAAGQQQSTTFISASLDEALQQGIGWLGQPSATGTTTTAQTPSFQNSFSSNTSSAEGLVWVSPLPTTQSYARVMDFLGSINGVDVAYPKEVLSGGVLFAITPRSAVSQVSSAANSTDWIRQSAKPSSANESRYADGISTALEYLR